jgi:hypothetical protein
MARAHTAGKEKHGNMAAGLASFACLFFFLFGDSCGGKKGILICWNFLQRAAGKKGNTGKKRTELTKGISLAEDTP